MEKPSEVLLSPDPAILLKEVYPKNLIRDMIKNKWIRISTASLFMTEKLGVKTYKIN